jgi:WhiB family transcriptional regulator, redox-sensing transcriptional regulator
VSETTTAGFVRRGSPRQDWRSWAACRTVDPDLFFPRGRVGVVVEHIEAAKAVCRSCPVQEACLDYALASNQQDGVWGGTSEEDRRRLRPARLSAGARGNGEHGRCSGGTGPDRGGEL